MPKWTHCFNFLPVKGTGKESLFFMVVAQNSHYLSQTLGIWWVHFTTFFSITVPFYGLILKAAQKGKKMKQQLEVTPEN